MEIWIAVVALSVAVWQLNLQRQEMQRNTRINSLIHMSTLLKERIEFYERIIQNMKSKKQDWTKHANRVNSELQPTLYKINSELLEAVEHKNSALKSAEIKKALRLPELSDYL